MLGYCMKCEKKQEMAKPRLIPKPMKNGSKRVSGTCPVCGTKMSVIVKKTFVIPKEGKKATKKPATKRRKTLKK